MALQSHILVNELYSATALELYSSTALQSYDPTFYKLYMHCK